MNPEAEVVTLFEAGTGAATPDDGLVTVAVSLFNYAPVIGACLDSVAAQTHAQLELIVVDDCSTDGSAQAAKRWLDANAGRFARARLVQPKLNIGLSRARNVAFEAAAAPFVFVLDADNLMIPRAIERLRPALLSSDAGCAYSQLVFFEAGEGIGAADVWSPEHFKTDNYIDAMSLVRKSAWRAVGGYSQLEYGWEDYDFWCKFVEAGIDGVFVPELLCRYRVHHDSMLRTDTAQQRQRLVRMMMTRHPWLDLRA